MAREGGFAASQAAVPLWRDIRVYRVAAQALFMLGLVLAGIWFTNNMLTGLARLGAGLGFGFLQGNAGFALAESSVPYDPSADSYLYAFLVGALNTLRVVVVGILLASMVGLAAGLARLSTNWMVARLAQLYVDIIRNTPLLIQLFFWYFAGALRLPRVRQSIELPGSIFLSNRGLILPWLTPNESAGTWAAAVAAALLLGIVLAKALGRLPASSFWHAQRGVLGLLVFLVGVGAAASVLAPFTPTIPKVEGFNYTGGLSLSPEYVTLLFGLVTYTGAFIAEIVRAGVLAVPRGLNEASRALGLSYLQTLRLVTVPLALRVIIPPLTNQYLNLAKNSSLAIAIGYADLFYVGNTIFNQSGQTVQVVSMIMATYLAISLVIATIMNGVNSRFRLVER